MRRCMMTCVRTTLTLADDVLDAARDLARAQGKPIGEVVSALARRGLQRQQPVGASRNGIPLLPASTSPEVTSLATVNALRDDPS